MAIIGKTTGSGTEKEFNITFTNGTLEQLKELYAFFKEQSLLQNVNGESEDDNLTEVIKFAIALLETIKTTRQEGNTSK